MSCLLKKSLEAGINVVYMAKHHLKTMVSNEAPNDCGKLYAVLMVFAA
jgi:hypothetical protein